MISIYFAINALEAFFLAIYLASIGSLPSERVFLNLSLSRLTIILLIGMVGIGFGFLAVRTWSGTSRIKKRIQSTFKSQKNISIAFLASLLVVAAVYFLLTTEKAKFLNYQQIYARFEPILVWAAVIGVQTALFAALAYCARFIDYSRSPETELRVSELPALFGVFAVFVAVKLLLVTATSYGPLGSGDEMTYFDMAESFHRGFFSIASRITTRRFTRSISCRPWYLAPTLSTASSS